MDAAVRIQWGPIEGSGMSDVVNRYQYDSSDRVSRQGQELPDLEFELVDFDTAREALAEPPPGVQPRASVNWEQRRRPLTPAELNPSAQGGQWLMSLPAELRPMGTAMRFARLVNLIAEHWSDPTRCLAVLDDLIVDRRGGRKGFPEAITLELTRLKDNRAEAAGRA